MNALSHRQTRREFRSGFTLLELIVVVSILAVMTAVVMPIFSSTFIETKKEHSVRDVITMMKYAQSLAVQRTVEHRFYFRPDEGRFWIGRLAGREKGEKVFELVQDIHSTQLYLTEDLKFDKPKAKSDKEWEANYVAFYPSGACDIATIKISAKGRNREKYEITTNGALNQFEVKVP